jgi:hypothetical protein
MSSRRPAARARTSCRPPAYQTLCLRKTDGFARLFVVKFDKAREAKPILTRIERQGILIVPCSHRGRRPFDVLQPNSRCRYDTPKFKTQRPEYSSLNKDQWLDRLCDEAAINMKMPFSPWTQVLEAGGIAAGVPVAVLTRSRWSYSDHSAGHPTCLANPLTVSRKKRIGSWNVKILLRSESCLKA